MSAEAFRRVVRQASGATDVQVGSGVRRRLFEEIALRFPAAFAVGLVVDERVAPLWGPSPPSPGPRALPFLAPAGEAAKCRDVLERLQDHLLDLRRDEPVVAVGGGALLDVAGFAAATVRRGLPWIAVPTTVVAMADASIGGKVAINHPRGKNLLGTFHPPRLVLADVDTLSTLPDRDRRAGLAEVYKAARVGDSALLERLRRGAPESGEGWVGLIAAALSVKARLVEADERDQGARRLLNFGHTLGHALERAGGPDAWRHGEAVAVGMMAAARIARNRGLLPEADVRRQERDLEALGLPVAWPSGISADAVASALDLDKKRRPGASHVFVLPSPGVGAAVVEDVSDEEVRAVLGP